MSKKETTKRYILFITGLFINAIGISLIIKAGLGSSPISSLPYTISLGFPITLGTLTFILNLFLIAGQIVLLKKDFKKIQWLQLPVSILFGFFIDLSMLILAWVMPEFYPWKMVTLLLGCMILGLGVSLEVIANVVMLSGEAFVHAISQKKKKEFGWVKIGFDCTLMILACTLSLILFGEITGVREGTIMAALLVGVFARFFNHRLIFLNTMLSDQTVSVTVEVPRKTQFVITIAREFGSGGREIGRKIASNLGIAFYDEELINMVATENNLTPGYVEQHEQNISSQLLYEFIMQDFTVPIEKSLSSDDALFVAQSKVIRKVASQHSCVIVGRCANYVLQDCERCFNIFLHADRDSKLKRIINEYGEPADKAESKLRRINKARANHYKAYTGRTWNDSRNYDLCLNTSILGIDEACKFIEKTAKIYLKRKDKAPITIS